MKYFLVLSLLPLLCHTQSEEFVDLNTADQLNLLFQNAPGLDSQDTSSVADTPKTHVDTKTNNCKSGRNCQKDISGPLDESPKIKTTPKKVPNTLELINEKAPLESTTKPSLNRSKTNEGSVRPDLKPGRQNPTVKKDNTNTNRPKEYQSREQDIQRKTELHNSIYLKAQRPDITPGRINSSVQQIYKNSSVPSKINIGKTNSSAFNQNTFDRSKVNQSQFLDLQPASRSKPSIRTVNEDPILKLSKSDGYPKNNISNTATLKPIDLSPKLNTPLNSKPVKPPPSPSVIQSNIKNATSDGKFDITKLSLFGYPNNLNKSPGPSTVDRANTSVYFHQQKDHHQANAVSNPTKTSVVDRKPTHPKKSLITLGYKNNQGEPTTQRNQYISTKPSLPKLPNKGSVTSKGHTKLEEPWIEREKVNRQNLFHVVNRPGPYSSPNGVPTFRPQRPIHYASGGSESPDYYYEFLYPVRSPETFLVISNLRILSTPCYLPYRHVYVSNRRV